MILIPKTTLLRVVSVAVAAASTACAGARVTAVSPDEIPQLEAQLAEEPDNGRLLLRYSAALFSAERCDSAVTVARRGRAIRPSDALGPMIIGQCMERRGDYDEAVATYREFHNRYPDERGVAAVRSRELIARRAQAAQTARQALAQEQQLTQQTPDISVVAVLPLAISGDSSYRPLSRGLAQILTSDLALLEQFRLVERLQLNALLQEIQLNQGDRVDQSTAVRVGHLVQAGRMVQGLAVIPNEQNVRLEASVVLSSGEVTGPARADGELNELLQMEKEIVIDISSQLGYTLSEAERQAILENGTRNLTAFLAYSRALEAEDLGDYNAAAQFYSQAVRADPGFQDARSGYESSAAASQVQEASASEITTVATETVEEPDAPAVEPVTDAATSTVTDLASTQSEDTAVFATSSNPGTNPANTNSGDPNTTTSNTGTTETVTGTIRIVFRLP